MELKQLPQLLEAILLIAAKPMTVAQLLEVLRPEYGLVVDQAALLVALDELEFLCQHRGIELVKLASGYCLRTRSEFAPWLSVLLAERPSKYSRALLETLALIAYKQPITRPEIEAVRGVSISSSIFKTLHEDRGWIRVVGYRDVPGKPALYATTKEFLDYFGCNSLQDLPNLPEVLQSQEPAAEKLVDAEMAAALAALRQQADLTVSDQISDDDEINFVPSEE